MQSQVLVFAGSRAVIKCCDEGLSQRLGIFRSTKPNNQKQSRPTHSLQPLYTPSIFILRTCGSLL